MRGLITRSKLCEGNLEESVLDFSVVCHSVLPYVTRMVIDKERKYILTNYELFKKGGKTADTDHSTEYMDLSMKVITEKPQKVVVLNLKKEGKSKEF